MQHWSKVNIEKVNNFIQLHFKLFTGVNVFIVELFLLYQTPTTGDKVNFITHLPQGGRILIK